MAYTAAPMIGVSAVRVLEPSPIDAGIPLLPWTIAIYASAMPFLVLALSLAPSIDALKNILAAMAIATVICVAIFIVSPAAIKRPDTHEAVLSALYLIDPPSNVFPSLYVALAAIAGAMWPHVRTRPLAWLWTCALVISALTTKQQIVISVFIGAVVGFGALVWSGAVERALRRATTH